MFPTRKLPKKLVRRILTIFVVISLSLDMIPILFKNQGSNLVIVPTASAFSIGRFGWPGLEWREIIDWWTSGYSRGVVIGRNYIPPCKLCDMPRMFRVDK